MSLGTSGTAYTILKKPFVDDHGEIACFCDSTGNYMPLLCVSNMAGGYNNFLKENNCSWKESTNPTKQVELLSRFSDD